MKCPKCTAQLLLVQSDYFCLQCGELVYGASIKGDLDESLKLESTSEPVLRRAILDVSDDLVVFSDPVLIKQSTSPSQTPNLKLPEPIEAQVPASTAESERSLHDAPVSSPATNPEVPIVTMPSLQATARVDAPHKSDLHVPVLISDTKSTIDASQSLTAPVETVSIDTVSIDLPHRKETAVDDVVTPDGAVTHGSIKTPFVYDWIHNLAYVSVAMGVLALINVGVGLYFQDKFYPGVAVSGRDIGGTPLASAKESIGSVKTDEYIDFVVGSTSYHLKLSEFGVAVDVTAQIDRAKEIGHSAPLPIIGVYESLKGRTVAVDYSVDEKIFNARVAQIAVEQSHVSTPASVRVTGSGLITLSDKTGERVDIEKFAAGIMSALNDRHKVVINTIKVSPRFITIDYKQDIDAAQARLNLVLTIKIKSKTVTVPTAEIARWIDIFEPNFGILVNGDRISDYVGTLGTGFDRAATVAALVSAVTDGRNLNYTASTKKTTALPKLPYEINPPDTYRYCISSKGVNSNNLGAIATKLESTYADPRGWRMNGLINFERVASGCNYTVWLVSPGEMESFSLACSKQTTCRVGNHLIINNDAWETAPSSWPGLLDDYRIELINHETGHWLGFDHLACGKGAVAPIQSTSVLLWGCSPNWWSVPRELQDIKVLPGF